MNGPVQESKLLKAAREFVRKCEAGEARSVKSYAAFKEAIAELETEPSPTRLKEGREEDNPTVQEVLKLAYAQTMQIDVADTELNEAKAVKAYQVINEIQDILGIYLEGDYNLWIESFRQSTSTPQPEGQSRPPDSGRVWEQPRYV